MKSKIKKGVSPVNLASTLLAILSSLVLIGLALYYYPRDVIDLSITIVDEQVEQGGLIYTENTYSTYADAESSYDNVLRCGRTNYFLYSVKANTEKRTFEENGMNSLAQYEIPAYVSPSPPDCHIVVDGRHTVDILPFLSRTYTSNFVSENSVKIIPKGE